MDSIHHLHLIHIKLHHIHHILAHLLILLAPIPIHLPPMVLGLHILVIQVILEVYVLMNGVVHIHIIPIQVPHILHTFILMSIICKVIFQ